MRPLPGGKSYIQSCITVKVKDSANEMWSKEHWMGIKII